MTEGSIADAIGDQLYSVYLHETLPDGVVQALAPRVCHAALTVPLCFPPAPGWRRRPDGDDELRFSRWVDNQTLASTLTIGDLDFSYVLEEDSCDFPGGFDGDVCGVWALGCSASFGSEDHDVSIEFKGRLGNAVGAASWGRRCRTCWH
jgi:hypothetical protein